MTETRTSTSPSDADAVGRHRAGPPDAGGPRLARFARRHRVGLTATALILFQLALRTRVGKDGFFLADDYVFVARVSDPEATWTALVRPHLGHVMPGALAWAWLVTTLDPYAWWLALGAALLGMTTAAVGVYLLLRQVFGARWGILPPLAVYLFSPFTLNATLWWAASLNAVPLQVCLVAALLCQVRLVRTGRPVHAAGVLLSTTVALAFFEKAVLIPVVLLLVTAWVIHRDGGAVAAVGRTVRRWWWEWAALAVLCGGYLAVYTRLVAGQARLGPRAEDVFDLVVTSTTTTLLPGVLGGPWSWQPFTDFTGATAAPGALGQWLAGEVVVIAVVVSFLLRRRVGRIWAILAIVVALDLALLALGRVWFFGPAVGTEYRYFAEAAPVLALCLAAAFLPVVGEPDPWRPLAGRARSATGLLPGEAVLSLVLANLILISGTISHERYAPHWWDNPGREYLTNVRRDLAGAVTPPQLFDGPPAAALQTPITEVTLADVLRPLPDQPQWVAQSEQPFVALADGHLAAARVQGTGTEDGPGPGCGWPVHDMPTIPLQGSAFDWEWFVELNYLASSDGSATVRLGDGSRRVELVRGVHTVIAPLDGGGSTLRVELDSPELGVCVQRAVVGNLVATP